MNQQPGQILLVSSAAEVGLVRELFREYQRSLDVDLGFQDFEQELHNLPGEYQAPYGALLLAMANGQPAGCCALRPLLSSDYTNACEMKRLYVRPGFRGLRLGRQLVAARELYQDCGFVEVAPYYHNPLPGAHYLKVEL